ncbi:replication protein RepA [Shewanella mesophila]|uniref:replication protein RepA n=1 Tax=Shewanella mesophila TaxID=2864208 RepID=UPI001C65E678|nr:replication protein RepA [Shewanella mesophila]QYJ84785.1 replication protein RepA [Shewanella mesophila]
MSLTDLKRRKPKPRKKLTIEEFIEDANNYAFGQPSLAGRTKKKRKVNETLGLKKQSTKIFKHATFTLTESSITELNQLAKSNKVAKSRLIRMMITEFAKMSEADLQQLIENSHD